MAETYMKDGIEYYTSNDRMVYNAEFHENHGKPFKVSELKYMCSVWGSIKAKDIAMALGRTESAVIAKVWGLKKVDEFEHYRKLGKNS